MKSRRTRVIVLNEPFGWPLSPFAIYEVNDAGLPTRELGRYRTLEEAIRVIRKEGWIY